METKKKSTSETGHAKNMANFKTLKQFCADLGSTYKPTQPKLSIATLESMLSTTDTAISAWIDVEKPWKTAINQRQIIYEPLDKFTTRLVAALDAATDDDKIIANAMTISRKIKNTRLSPVIQNPNPDDSKQISNSQQSFDMKLHNFKNLLSLLKQEPLYNPAEEDLKILSIKNLITNIDKKNEIVVKTFDILNETRIVRDKILYAPKSGLVDVALEIKKYIKSIYGTKSAKYKQISGLKFSRPRKKK